MKKLLFIILVLLISASCYADTATYLRNADGTVISIPFMGTSVKSGHNSSVATGTAVTLGSGECSYVTIRADATNKETIYVGGSDVSTSNGYALSTSATVSIYIDNLSDIYLLSAAPYTGDNGVSYVTGIK